MRNPFRLTPNEARLLNAHDAGLNAEQIRQLFSLRNNHPGLYTALEKRRCQRAFETIQEKSGNSSLQTARHPRIPNPLLSSSSVGELLKDQEKKGVK